MLWIKLMGTPCELTLVWMLWNAFDDNSAKAQVMAWTITSVHVAQDLCGHVASQGHDMLNSIIVKWFDMVAMCEK